MEKKFVDVRLNFHEAKQLAELFAISDDLKYVFHTGKLFNEIYKPSENSEPNYPYDKNALISRSMWNSMLIAYARCFATGVRYGLSPKIFDTHEQAVEIKKSHKYFIDMRSKDIAHSINSKETSETVALLSDIKEKEKKVETIVCYGMRYIGGKSEVEVLCNLTVIANKYIENEVAKYQEIVLKKAREIDIEKLYKFPKSRFIAPGNEEAGKPRNR
ncbi:hypothetical protein [Flavobacterium mekongense]|uniref:hypothetical protein n=1 Tax=Flavobacterium mekongense TaxID=3379707 RepID=UPI00399B77A6